MHASSVPDLTTERSPLTKHPDSTAVYGIYSSPSDTDDGTTEGSSLLSRSEDEEASIETPITPAGAPSHDSHLPLTSRAVVWIVLPMLLG